jgi:hypothetical protein
MRPCFVISVVAFASLVGSSSAAFAMECIGGASRTKYENHCRD